eukprot:scaffold31966_cov45-Prasinocladus_malaysianus.AAC.1
MALADSDHTKSLLGTSHGAESALLVTELAHDGSLYNFYYEEEDKYMQSWARRVDLGKQIASALHYLHSKKPPVLHCDLKSKNVLLKKGDDGHMIAKLCDFGQALTKMTQSHRSTLPSFRGTLAWCAPEVLGSTSPTYTEMSDVYSLGMVLYELAALAPPFDGAVDLLGLIKNDQRPTLPDDTPEDLKSIIQDCWHQNPKRRPTCTDVCRRLVKLAEELNLQQKSQRFQLERFDLFLTHNWGNGNHERVARVCKSLQCQGVKCWFDDERMMGNVIETMARGLDNSTGILVFITNAYRAK